MLGLLDTVFFRHDVRQGIRRPRTHLRYAGIASLSRLGTPGRGMVEETYVLNSNSHGRRRSCHVSIYYVCYLEKIGFGAGFSHRAGRIR
jgi:hypothetical protein